MTPRDFCFWLQGHMEINNPETISAEQVEMIKEHIDLTFAEMKKQKEAVSQPQQAQPISPFGTTIYAHPLTGSTLIC